MRRPVPLVYLPPAALKGSPYVLRKSLTRQPRQIGLPRRDFVVPVLGVRRLQHRSRPPACRTRPKWQAHQVPDFDCQPGNRLFARGPRSIARRRICRRQGIKRFPYFCVFEATKAGEPHLHILARMPYVDQAWLSVQMAALIDAPICDIRAVKSARHVAYYLAKYVGKDPHHFGTCKRYWTTRDWRVEYPVPEEPDPIWTDLWYVCKWPLTVLAAGWKAKGWDVQMEDGMLVAMAREPP